VTVRGDTLDFDEQALPLSVGPGSQAAVPVPGGDLPAVAAFVGHSGDRFYVQPAPGARGIEVNGEALAGSRWLAAGDAILIGDATLTVSSVSDSLEMHLEESEDVTAPPLLVDEPAAGAEPVTAETVSAVEFRRETAPAPPSERRRRTGFNVLVYGLLTVLALLAWFIFTATPVRIEADPATAEVELDGGLFRWRLSDHYLLRPGTYQVTARHPEYEDLEQTLEVTGDGPDGIRLALVRLPDAVTVQVQDVADAVVLVDGERVGEAPLEDWPLREGSYVLRVEAPRYQAHEETLDIAGGGARRSVDVELAPDWAVYSISTRPEGAELRVGDELAGTTPLSLELLSGTREVLISKEGFKTWSERLEVTAGDDRVLDDIVLEPADARLSVVTRPSGASVLLDGQYVGRTPLELSLEGGEAHRIQLSRAGSQDARRTVTLASGESKTLRVDLAGRTGLVRVDVSPPDAKIYVDGRPAAPKDGVLELTSVPHSIEARAPGHASASVSVTPRPGFEQRVSLRLKTDAQVKAESIKPVIATAQGLEMRLVQPGRFLMGSSRRDQGRRSNESLRQVELTRPFYIAVTETTNGQFREFDSKHYSGAVGGLGLDAAKQPVANVSWDQAARYCNWLSARDKLPPAYREEDGKMLPVAPVPIGYRLPTEAEWVWVTRYAGRAGDAPRYPWGPKMPPTGEAGNFADESARATAGRVIAGYNDKFPVSAPVGSFPPNGLGLNDAGGNVAEWTNDIYGVYPGDRSKLVVDPTGAQSGEFRVIRGSSWMHSSITELRWTYRDYGDKPRADVGFRIVRYLE
jgi:formylglycine-generating enzyme required for sulfatase activity